MSGMSVTTSAWRVVSVGCQWRGISRCQKAVLGGRYREKAVCWLAGQVFRAVGIRRCRHNCGVSSHGFGLHPPVVRN
jgi:hypothetical protein